jgi:hypothetical protein
MDKSANQKSQIVEKIQQEVARSFAEKRNEPTTVNRPEKLIYIRF